MAIDEFSDPAGLVDLAESASPNRGIPSAPSSAIPGPDYPVSVQSDWPDYWLEPKQQHRFLCSFPVYMPIAGSGVYDTRALKQILAPKGVVLAGTPGARVASYRRAAAAAAISRAKKSQGGDTGSGARTEMPPRANTSGRRRLAIKSKKDQKALVAKYLQIRPQTYIVASFTPPSYGSNIPEGTVPGGRDHFAKTLDAAAKLNDATITLVSTVRDDLHFSMNLIFQLAQKNNAADGGLSAALFPESIWGEDLPEEKRILTVLDMGARPDPTETITPAMGVPQFFDSVPLGIHKLYQPQVTNIAFGEYSYEGSAFLTTTLTLKPKGTAFSGYSYSTYVSQKTGVMTRDTSQTSPDRYIVTDGTDFGYELPKLLADAYARYPNFFVKAGSLGVDGTGQQKPFPNSSAAEIQKHISLMTGNRLRLQDLKIDTVMGRAEGTPPDKRKGMLAPLLKTKAQQIADQEARAAAAAEAATARQTAEEKAILDEQREGDHAQRIADLQARGGETTGGEAATLEDDGELGTGESPTHDEAREYATEPPPDPANVTQTTPEEQASGIPEEIDWGEPGGPMPEGEQPESPGTGDWDNTNAPADNDLTPLQTGAGEPDQTPTEQHFPGAPRPEDTPEHWTDEQQRTEESYSGSPGVEVPDSGAGSPFGGPGNNIHGSNGNSRFPTDAAGNANPTDIHRALGQDILRNREEFRNSDPLGLRRNDDSDDDQQSE
mgnify:CR=1 FL=1|tara:strand:+ start:2428 stop:4584 length:2157 start_codon:yes stop_codon:yes gene_type:complete